MIQKLVKFYDRKMVCKFLIFLWGFYLFFMPDLEPFIPAYKNVYILFIIDTLILIYYNKEITRYLRKTKCLAVVAVLVISSIYTLVVTILNKISIMNNLNSITAPMKLLCLIGLILALRKLYPLVQDKLKYLIIIGTIQGFFCILMLLFKPLKEIANSLYIYNIPNYFESSLVGITGSRIYGITGDYTFSTPIFMALLSGLSIFLFTVNKEKKYIGFAVINIFGSMLNGRTGLFLLIAVLLVIFILNIRKMRVNKKFVLIFSILIIAMVLAIYFLDGSIWLEWLNKGIEEVLSLLKGEKVGTIAVLLDYVFFPNGLDFFFGMGSKVYGDYGISLIGKVSDLGLTNDFFRGGLIYIMLFYGSVIYMFKLGFKASLNIFKLKEAAIIIFICAFFLFFSNLKGEAMSASSIMLACVFVLISLCDNEESIDLNIRGFQND